MNNSSSTVFKAAPLAILFGVLIAVSNSFSDSIHLPIFINTALSVILGWIAPRKGWILALIQGITTFIAYFSFTTTGLITPEHKDIADFATYISLFPTLSGSFIDGFIKRALH